MRPASLVAACVALLLHGWLLLVAVGRGEPAAGPVVRARLVATALPAAPVSPPAAVGTARQGESPDASALTTAAPASGFETPLPAEVPAPTPARPPEEQAVVPAAPVDTEGYRLLVREAVAGHRSYPYAARVRRQEGTAVVSFSLDAQGALRGEPKLVGSSSFARLDEAARAAVSAAAPFPPPPADIDWTFVLPVTFVLD